MLESKSAEQTILSMGREGPPSCESLRSLDISDQYQDVYQLLHSSIEDYAIFMLDPAGNIRSWNRGAECIKGYASHEIIGRHFSVFYPQADVQAGKPAGKLIVAKTVGRIEDEGWRMRKDGTRFWANVIITALRDADGILQGYAKVTRDLSERKQREVKLLQAYHELEQIAGERAIVNRELHELTRTMAGREYRIRELESEVRLLRLRIGLTPILGSEPASQERA